MSKELTNIEYSSWIKDLKTKIREAQNKVAFTINSQLLELYWELGKELALRQKDTGWEVVILILPQKNYARLFLK